MEMSQDRGGWLELASEVFHVGQNRALAREVCALATLVVRSSQASQAPFSPSTQAYLVSARDLLVQMLERQRISGPVESLPAPPPPSSSVEAPLAPTPPATIAAAPAPVRDAAQEFKMAGALIEFCDTLEQGTEEALIPAERTLKVVARKAATLLAEVGLSRIDRRGTLDESEQEIVETVIAPSAAHHMQIADTVQCGYKLGNQLLRKQRVMLYLFEAR